MNTKTAFLLAAGLIVLFGAGLGVGYVLFQQDDTATANSNTNVAVSEGNQNGNLNDNANIAIIDQSDVEPYDENVNADSEIQPIATEPTTGEESVSDIPSLDLINVYTDEYGYSHGQYESDSARYYSAGTITKGTYAGDELILLVYSPEGPAFYPNMVRFVRKDDGSLVLLSLYSSSWLDALDTTTYTVDATAALPEYDYPGILIGESARQVLRLDADVDAFFDATGLRVAFTDATWGKVYEDDGTGTAEGIFSKNGFYLMAPDGTVRVYALDVDFQDDNEILDITWNNGQENYTAYSLGEYGGCGLRNYASVVADGGNVIANDLVQTGTSARGDAIYEYKDSNATFLRDWYDSGNWGTWNSETQTADKPSYTEYVSQHPFVFWTDPFGRLIRAQSSLFTPLAECGKPVIYLYPEKPTQVAVTVEPTGGFSYTDPVYVDGWNVTADPDGRLWNGDGKTYPYLFWEGRGDTAYETPDRGFVVAQADVPGFLDEKLAALGLRGREITDFKEFWVPRMQDAPWYFVTFLGNQAMDTLAPLTVTPAPDTVIRILMDFHPLEQPVDVEGYDIQTPQRRGFTVVEWGGVLR